MFKEILLQELLEFSYKKRQFTKEEFLIHLWFKYRYTISFETILRKIRTLRKQGFLEIRKVPIKEWGIGYRAILIPKRRTIEAYLRRKPKQIELIKS